MTFNNLIQEKFLLPIQMEAGYNFYNTLVYAIVALFCLYMIFKAIKATEIKIDIYFFISLIPFIFFGSFARSLVDRGYIYRTFWVVSPGIYITTSILYFATLTMSYMLVKSNLVSLKTKDYWRICSAAGVIYLGIVLISVVNEISLRNGIGLLKIILIFSFAAISSVALLKTFKVKWVSHKIALFALFAHLLDASSTFVITKFYGGKEKHPLPRWVMESSGTEASFFVLKLIFLIPAIYIIVTQIDDKELRDYLLISIAILGFAEGLRNIISLVLA